ncbi:MAG TPA: hypothetical protein VHF67_13445 [Gaiellaceae bacterium]|nr:hypothetical protein [Gaiellaceae bacterium]
MKRADAKRAELDLQHPLGWKVAAEPRWHISSRRHERGHGLALETRHGVREQCERRSVQPLNVVDGE